MAVLKVSLPGIDVKTATPEECAVHSDFVAPKIDVSRGHFVTIDIDFKNEPPAPDPSGGETHTIVYRHPHGYGYKPQVWAHVDYQQVGGGATFGPAGPVFLGANSVEDETDLSVTADKDNVYITIDKYTFPLFGSPVPYEIAGQLISVRLYIMAEEAVNS